MLKRRWEPSKVLVSQARVLRANPEREREPESEQRNSERGRENHREPKRARESQRESERARENQREPERGRENQREPKRVRMNQREPERARESLTQLRCEPTHFILL